MSVNPQVSAHTLHLVLGAVQVASGPQYPQLLTAAGLDRYRDQLPPDDGTVAGTAAELERLFAAIYQMLGESLGRLFQKNWGAAFATGILHGAWAQQQRLTLGALPAADRVARFLPALAAISDQRWLTFAYSEDAEAWYMAAAYCPVCVAVPPPDAPVCSYWEVLVKTLTEQIAGQRVRVREIECRALGAPACRYAIYKPAPGDALAAARAPESAPTLPPEETPHDSSQP